MTVGPPYSCLLKVKGAIRFSEFGFMVQFRMPPYGLGHFQVGSYRYRSLIAGLYTL